MNTYTHRNGESEPPAEPGEVYWFAGTLTWGHLHKRYRGLVIIDDGRFVYPYGVTEFYSAAQSTGAWWGPVTPPWEEEQPCPQTPDDPA